MFRKSVFRLTAAFIPSAPAIESAAARRKKRTHQGQQGASAQNYSSPAADEEEELARGGVTEAVAKQRVKEDIGFLIKPFGLSWRDFYFELKRYELSMKFIKHDGKQMNMRLIDNGLQKLGQQQQSGPSGGDNCGMFDEPKEILNFVYDLEQCGDPLFQMRQTLSEGILAKAPSDAKGLNARLTLEFIDEFKHKTPVFVQIHRPGWTLPAKHEIRLDSAGKVTNMKRDVGTLKHGSPDFAIANATQQQCRSAAGDNQPTEDDANEGSVDKKEEDDTTYSQLCQVLRVNLSTEDRDQVHAPLISDISCQSFSYLLLSSILKFYSDTSLFRDDYGRTKMKPQTSTSRLLSQEIYKADEAAWHTFRSSNGMREEPWPIPSLAIANRAQEHIPMLK